VIPRNQEAACTSRKRQLAQRTLLYRRSVADNSFETPEEAAVADFHPNYVRVASVSYSEDRTHATVKLLMNEKPSLYEYYSYCERDANGRWRESHSSN
jgi:hypothetical protein